MRKQFVISAPRRAYGFTFSGDAFRPTSANGLHVFPPLGGPLPKKTRWATTYTKNFAPNCVPTLNFRGGPKKVGQYTHTKNTLHMLKTPFLVRFFFQFTGSTFPEIECLKGGGGGGSEYSESWTVIKDWSQLSELPSSSLVIHLMCQVFTLFYNSIKMTWKQACSELFSQYTELLEDFYAIYEELENTIAAVEQCMSSKDTYEL